MAARGDPMRRAAAVALVPVVLACLMAGCSSPATPDVMATFYPLQFFTERIAGDLVSVGTVVRPGVEPHDYEPTPRDLKAIADARLLVIQGAGFESWLVTAQANAPEVRLAVTTEGIVLRPIGADGHGQEAPEHDDPFEDTGGPDAPGTDGTGGTTGHSEPGSHDGTGGHNETSGHAAGETGEADPLDEASEGGGHADHATLAGDPHVWLDPVKAQRMARNIQNGLIAAFPEHGQAFTRNANALVDDLARLHHDFDDGLATCEVRVIVTSHDAFGYVADRYGITQVPITGLDPHDEPDPQALDAVIQEARRHGVDTVFFEELVSPQVARSIASEIGAKTLVLNPIEGLTQQDQAQGKDYFAVMRANLANLREGMRCA